MASKPSPQDRNILIASSNLDRPAWQPIANDLTRRGFTVWPFLGDRIASGSVPFDIVVDEEFGMLINYNDYQFRLDTFDAAFWHRPNKYIPDENTSWEQQLRINAERRAALETIWNVVPEWAWLNSPDRMRRAGDKLGQLAVAQSLGLRITRSLQTNSWSTILDELPSDVIFKTPTDILHGDGTFILRALRIVDTNDPALLERIPFPGIWQKTVSGEAELRVTIVGDKVFAATIRTAKKQTGGWKWAHTEEPRIMFETSDIPADMKAKFLQFLAHYKLRMGSFKLIQSGEDYTVIDFEAHPNWGWQEEALGHPIAKAIADQLAKIALTHEPTSFAG